MVRPEDYDESTDFFVLDETVAHEQAKELAALVLTTDGCDCQDAVVRLCVETSPMYMREIVTRAITIVGAYATFNTTGPLMARHFHSNLLRLILAANTIAYRYGILPKDSDEAPSTNPE